MTTDTLYSRTITNLSGISGGVVGANLKLYDTAGFNIAARKVTMSDYCTPTALGLASTSSTYYTVRLRSRFMLRSMKLFVSTALDTGGLAASLTFDIGAYYSNATDDGTQPQLQGTSIGATKFGSAVVPPTSAGINNAVQFLSLKPADMDKMLWDFLGLTSDPGGFIDVVVAVHAAANTAASGDLGIEVEGIEPS